MSLKRSVAIFVVVMSLVPFAVAQERDELLATPKLEENAKQPVFAELTAEQVASGITVVSGRNYAWFGFNTPEIHLVLPEADNSVYAKVEFGEVTLFDAAGAEVAYERELGLYDSDTHHTELRCVAIEGDEPVVFERAVGTATVRYPLQVHTLSVRAGAPSVEGLDVSFDGPFVTRRSNSGSDDLESASFTGVTSFRALDAEGQRLERTPSTKFSMTNGAVTEVFSYWGEVAGAELDVVDEWAVLRIDFELPSVALLPEERAGIAPPDGDENPPTPGAKIDVKVIEETAGMVIAAELGVSADEAMEQLREHDYPAPSGDYMVMSALQGKLDTLKLFLAAGYPIDFTTNDGRTALSSAVMYGRNEIAHFLIGAGADVNIADANNSTPLTHAAGKCDSVELVRALLAAGADPTPATAGGVTAAQMAGIMSCTENEAAITAALE